jgi:tRNA (cmo5U34)-methyltransferase
MTDTISDRSTTGALLDATWGDKTFIENWATKGSWQAPIRDVQVEMALRMIPQSIDAPIRVLDIGAGYGAMAAAVLHDRPNATALCLDASDAMLKLGAEKNASLKDRISFVQGSLETPDWIKSVHETFDVVISSRALHHFTENQRRRYIFKEVYDLLRAGGCFINADNVRAANKSLTERYRAARDEYLDRRVRQASGGKINLVAAKAASPSTYHGPHNNGHLEEELAWLLEAGFQDVDCFWKFTTMVVYGGFKP